MLTVGYGDVQITTEATRGFACFYIIVSVSWLAALISLINGLLEQRHADEKLFTVMGVSPTQEQLEELDQKGNSDGKLDEIEFVIGMIDLLGVKPLGNCSMCQLAASFRAEFKRLDHNNNKFLTKDDLVLYKPRSARLSTSLVDVVLG